MHVIVKLGFADGGPPMVVTRLAVAQARLGHDVSVVYYSSNPKTDQETDQLLATLPHWDQVKVHRLPPDGRLERLLGYAAGRQMRPWIETTDVLHLHNVWEGILLRTAAIARQYRKPYLVLANGMLEPWSLAQKALKKRIGLMLAHRRMLNGSAMLHFLNDEERDLVGRLGLTAPTVVIPNGVMLEEIDPLPPRGEFMATHPELRGRRFVLFLSRLHYKKGLDYLADGFARIAPQHPDVDLVVAGPDGGEHENFTKLVAAVGMNQRVHLVGPIYGRQKYAALVDADCFTLPSRQEGFSVAVLEAMAASTPVVITQACHFPQVTSVGAGEVIPTDSAALAAALDRVLSSPNRAAMGRAGRALIETEFTWDRVAQRTIAAYQQCIESVKR